MLLPPRLFGRELDWEVARLPPLFPEPLDRARAPVLPLLAREELPVELRVPRDGDPDLARAELERTGLERLTLGALRRDDRVAAVPGLGLLRPRARMSTRDPPPGSRGDVTSDFIRCDSVARVVSRGRASTPFVEEPPVRRPTLVGRLESSRRVALGRDPPDPALESPERAFCRVPDPLREEPDRVSCPESPVRGFERSDPASDDPVSSRSLERGPVCRVGAAGLDELSRGVRPPARSLGVRAFVPSRVVRGWAMLSYRSRKRRLVLCASRLRGWARVPGALPRAPRTASSLEIRRGYERSARVGLGRGIDGCAIAPGSVAPRWRSADAPRVEPAPDPGRTAWAVSAALRARRWEPRVSRRSSSCGSVRPPRTFSRSGGMAACRSAWALRCTSSRDTGDTAMRAGGTRGGRVTTAPSCRSLPTRSRVTTYPA